MDCISRAVDIDILSRNSSFGFDSAPFISYFGIFWYSGPVHVFFFSFGLAWVCRLSYGVQFDR